MFMSFQSFSVTMDGEEQVSQKAKFLQVFL